MSYINPLQIGILACPASRAFAARIVEHLKKSSQQEFHSRIAALAQKHSLDKQEIIASANLYKNLLEPMADLSGPPDQFHTGSCEIEAIFSRFANGEFKTEIMNSVRGMDVFIIQDVSNHYPVAVNDGKEELILSINDHLFCLIATVDAALQAGARRVTCVLPTYPYARQHKKRTREGLTAARVGQILENMGVERIITLDIHSREIENTFNVSVH